MMVHAAEATQWNVLKLFRVERSSTDSYFAIFLDHIVHVVLSLPITILYWYHVKENDNFYSFEKIFTRFRSNARSVRSMT